MDVNIFSPISITGFGSISPLGVSEQEVWNSYLEKNHLFSKIKFADRTYWASSVKKENKEIVENIRKENKHYRSLDLSVLYAIYSCRKATKMAGWVNGGNFGINIGSSRGATSLFEKYYRDFLQNGISVPQGSPNTTLGNISSWVAQDLSTKGPEFSHSITCSTGMHSILNGCVWLQAGMSDKFVVGGSEAPITEFTISQMLALRIYARDLERSFPSQSGNLDKKISSIVLGEGSATIAIEKEKSKNAIAYIIGVGYATEKLKHSTSISSNAECFQKSMRMALTNYSIQDVDAIVSHTPGTRLGDLAEIRAINQVFRNRKIPITNNKWKIGHTFGPSGNFSIELALLMLKNQKFVYTPFHKEKPEIDNLNMILVNSVGFGGNAVSLLISKDI